MRRSRAGEKVGFPTLQTSFCPFRLSLLPVPNHFISFIRSPSKKKSNFANWYPLKITLASAHYRMIFFESAQLQSEVLHCILKSQGFSNQLDQYKLEQTIDEGQCNAVVIGES